MKIFYYGYLQIENSKSSGLKSCLKRQPVLVCSQKEENGARLAFEE